MRRRVLLVALLFLVVGCAGHPRKTPAAQPPVSPSPTGAASPSGPAVTAPAPLVVLIRNFAFLPQNPSVAVGQRIVIVNQDAAAHTWSAGPKSGWTYTSGNLERGQKASFPGFSKPGHYRVVCYYHAEMPAMTGIVTVQ